MSETISTMRNHIVILGWSPRVERIIGELRNEVHRASGDVRPILIITEFHSASLSTKYERVYFMYGRVNDLEILRQVNLEQAHSLLIPAVLPEASSADGQSVFSLLAALAVNPAIRVCVEVSRAESGETLKQIRERGFTSGDVEVVSFESVAGRLLAQAAVSRGVTRVYDHLLSFGENSNEVYAAEIADAWIGKTFRQLAAACFDASVILIGYENSQGLSLNPRNRDAVLSAGDRVWYISYNRAEGLQVVNPDELSRIAQES